MRNYKKPCLDCQERCEGCKATCKWNKAFIMWKHLQTRRRKRAKEMDYLEAKRRGYTHGQY